MTTPTGSFAPNTLVNAHYHVARQNGRGGMGALYEAVDTRLGNRVARKQTLVRRAQLDDSSAAPQPTLPTAPPQPAGGGCWPLALIGLVAALLVLVLGGALFLLAGSFAARLDPGAPLPTSLAIPTEDPREQEPIPPAPTAFLPGVEATVAAVQTMAGGVVAEAQATAEAAFGNGPQAGPALGVVTLAFGEEGVGDGFLDDPRGIAVGPDGAIYVADYINRRIQRFSAAGRFERSFFVEDERPILALAADRQGRVLVAQNFQVSVFDGATGALLSTFTDGQGSGFEDLEVLGDGSLIAIPWAGRDLVRLSADGVEIGRISDILAAADTDQAPQALAADGLGTLYILADSGETVYIFGPDGIYRDKFSVPDANPFGELAVDRQGRIYVSGFFHGVQVFEADGRQAGTVDLDGIAFGLTFDGQNSLYAATNRPRVVKVTP